MTRTAKIANLLTVVLPPLIILACIVVFWNDVVGIHDLLVAGVMYLVTGFGITIGNAIRRILLSSLQGAAIKLGWRYTRYADDLTFSGGEELVGKVGWLLAKVRNIARGEGFAGHEAQGAAAVLAGQ